MNEEEKRRTQQDSGGKEGVEDIRLDRQKVYDFFLSVSNENSGKVDQKLTMDEKVIKKTKRWQQTKALPSFYLSNPAVR